FDTSSKAAGSGGWTRSAAARLSPDVDRALRGEGVDPRQLLVAEVEPLEGAEVLFELRDAARADERRGDPWVAARPRERHLGQRLAACRGGLPQAAHLRERLLVELVPRERAVTAGTRPFGDPVRVPVGEHPLRQRREDDATDPVLVEDV